MAPGAGHLLLHRRRSGTAILAVFGLVVVAVVLVVASVGRSELLAALLSTRSLVLVVAGAVVAAAVWVAVIVRTYLIARPRGLDPGRQVVGIVAVALLCAVVVGPLGYAANLANSQRALLDTVFTGDGGGTSAAEAISKPRLNILLVGSDAGPDRTGARTDTMMVASIDTRTGATTLFGLPRNIGYAPFPAGSAMAARFPRGFHDPNGDATSGTYLLNAVYAWGRENPAMAPTGPTADPGLNLLHQTVSTMLGLPLDYYIEVNMAGFASIIDALGGLTVDVGPRPVPIGGILPDGRRVTPDGYVPAGVQHLTGAQALAFARSRTDSTDYTRMGRQRCLLQNILTQNSPTSVLVNFQAIAAATTASVATNIPQQVLPALVTLAGAPSVVLQSVSFDPTLPDPAQDDGTFNPARPDLAFMRATVQNPINQAPARPPATTAAPTTAPRPDEPGAGSTPAPSPPPAATSLGTSCA